jgi:uncharacterized protein (DUF697 family)
MSTTASPTPAPAATAPAAETPPSRSAQAHKIIRRDVLWALGAGAVPIPIVDIAAVTAVEIKLLRELSAVYEVKFSEGIAKKIAYSLLSSIGAVGIGSVVGGSLAKLIPVVGSALGFVAVPIIVAAFTHALGQVLVMHFEAGGTLLDFNPDAMRAHFKQEFEKAKQTVSTLQTETPKSPAKPA